MTDETDNNINNALKPEPIEYPLPLRNFPVPTSATALLPLPPRRHAMLTSTQAPTHAEIPIQALPEPVLERLVQRLITDIYDLAGYERPRTITLPFLDVIVTEKPSQTGQDANKVIEELRIGLAQARDWFLEYAHMHEANGKHEKAEANTRRASYFALVLDDPMYADIFKESADAANTCVTKTPEFVNAFDVRINLM